MIFQIILAQNTQFCINFTNITIYKNKKMTVFDSIVKDENDFMI